MASSLPVMMSIKISTDLTDKSHSGALMAADMNQHTFRTFLTN